ncbi:protein Luc7p [Diutina catenulata]
MADLQRQAIEQLMGREALHSDGRRGRPPTDFTSSRVCKSFLVGTCPHDLFVGTKQDLGKCPQLHLEKHRLEYQQRVAQGRRYPEFEYDYYKHLRQYIQDLDTQIAVAHKRLEHTPEEKEKIAAAMRELDVADSNIALMAQEIECLVAAGDIVGAVRQEAELDRRQAERAQLFETARNLAENVGQTSQQKLQVCEGCGAYLSRLDSDRRIADHLMGKIHLGYVQMRKAYEELHAKFEKR